MSRTPFSDFKAAVDLVGVAKAAEAAAWSAYKDAARGSDAEREWHEADEAMSVALHNAMDMLIDGVDWGDR